MTDISTKAALGATVAIVGRPNVGKSTLFNRLVGRRQAIVHDQPGATRDRIVAACEIEDDQWIELIDTGGLVPADADPLGLHAQVGIAIAESDLVLLVVDGREGLVVADERVAAQLRTTGKPVVVVVNKGDTRSAQAGWHEFHRLGMDDLVLVSAEHGSGVAALRSLIAHRLPAAAAPRRGSDTPALAVVGRPNVGKSSLVNRLLGAERSLVSPVAGTTRDPVDSVLEREEGGAWTLIDTAGIRRRSQVSGLAEDLAVMLARRQIERADVVVLVIDAVLGVTTGDLAIAGEIWEQGRAALVAVNKWDLLDEDGRARLDASWPRLGGLLRAPPRVNVSALSGRGVDKLLPAADQALARYRTLLATAEINRLFERAAAAHHAPSLRGQPWRMYYATQVATGPPTFVLFANRPLPPSHGYRRYLENSLREELGLPGVPIRLVVRRRAEREPPAGKRRRKSGARRRGEAG